MTLPNPEPLFKAIRSLLIARTGKGFQTDAEVQGINRAIEASLVPLAVPGAPTAPVAAPGGIRLGLTASDFQEVAQRLRCTVAQIRAIWEVECAGAGFFTDDVRGEILEADGPGGFIDGVTLPKILFEAHHFARFTGGRFNLSHPNLSSPKWNRALYVGGQGEWLRLHKAMQLDAHAALLSASVGGPQIMGFNHKLAGHETVEGFWAAMKASERAHLDAFAAFIVNSGLGDKLRMISNDPATCRPIARGYNGPAYAANRYDVKIAQAHKKWS